jgi:hypothetical protein
MARETPAFSVCAISQFDRPLRRVERRPPELADIDAEAVALLRTDPYHRTRQ